MTFVRRQRVHHVVAVAGEPFPVGPKVEQRAMREHHNRCGLWEPREVGLHPGKLFGADFWPSAGDVVERDEVDTAMVEEYASAP